MEKEESLFDRIGGMEAVDIAVTIFYDKVLTDTSVNHFFESIDMDTQAGKLKAFLAYAFGAPLNYSGKNMKDAHASMKITEEHFNAIAGHLIDTLRDINVKQDQIDEVIEIALSTKNDIVNS
ncbi:hemoglobin [Saonia flava]|uniref:Group 1 truncated hemoglobin n=1 Tax=Saonia flava TaxID=523696 RepID=A0A846R354_9FLAO|nr:group 1 truncated hemoglobin [Saonia flava]NJB72823.1 hemoglobin [Saonia flava]